MTTILRTALLFGTLTMGSVVLAGSPHPVGKWCAADQQKLCSGMEWGTGLGKCLHENAANVSATCKQHHPKLFGSTPPTANSNGQ